MIDQIAGAQLWVHVGDRLRFVERDGQRILQQQMTLMDISTLNEHGRKWVDVPLEPDFDELAAAAREARAKEPPCL